MLHLEVIPRDDIVSGLGSSPNIPKNMTFRKLDISFLARTCVRHVHYWVRGKQAITGSSDPRAVHVDRLTVRQNFLRVLQFPLPVIPSVLHSLISYPGLVIIGSFKATGPGD